MEPPEQEFPTEFRAFLYSCIDSVEQAEILVLLCRSYQAWNARGVAAELGVTDPVARHHLKTLSARGLLQITIAHEVTYSYRPKSPDLRRYGDQLAEYYATSRTELLRFIATSPRRVKRFADAFKLRDSEWPWPQPFIFSVHSRAACARCCCSVNMRTRRRGCSSGAACPSQ